MNEQLAYLVTQMHEAHLAAQEAAKAISSDLKSSETRKVELSSQLNNNQNINIFCTSYCINLRTMPNNINLITQLHNRISTVLHT